MPWYEDDELWSGFSEVVFSPARAARAADAVANSPLFRFPAGARVFDQCCGPAVWAVPLARHGYAVTGMDLSPVMLARAEKACAEAGVQVELVRADMREFVRPGAFDAVVNLYTSFGYFEDPAENLRVLRNAYESLAPGGVLIVDLLGKEVYAKWAGETKTVPVRDGTVFMSDTVFPDWIRYRTDWTLVRGDTARHTSLVMWAYSAAELRGMFEAAGFGEVACFGDFDGRPYDNTAERLIVRGIHS
jgi:SAM-dependent methyltransferase